MPQRSCAFPRCYLVYPTDEFKMTSFLVSQANALAEGKSHPLLDRVRQCSATPDAAADFFAKILHPCSGCRLRGDAFFHPYMATVIQQMKTDLIRKCLRPKDTGDSYGAHHSRPCMWPTLRNVQCKTRTAVPASVLTDTSQILPNHWQEPKSNTLMPLMCAYSKCRVSGFAAHTTICSHVSAFTPLQVCVCILTPCIMCAYTPLQTCVCIYPLAFMCSYPSLQLCICTYPPAAMCLHHHLTNVTAKANNHFDPSTSFL